MKSTLDELTSKEIKDAIFEFCKSISSIGYGDYEIEFVWQDKFTAESNAVSKLINTLKEKNVELENGSSNEAKFYDLFFKSYSFNQNLEKHIEYFKMQYKDEIERKFNEFLIDLLEPIPQS